ncbi:hypothetical protein GF420_16005 [candidate division GN15 bacterium]|nr:hypothetical protein [candidate division GN15 bacterium]
MKIAVSVLVTLLLCGSLSARELSLARALELARAHSYVLKQARAEAEASASLESAAERERWPTLDVSASGAYASYVPTLDLELPFGESFSREIGTHQNYQADIRLLFPVYTGGRISGGIDRAEAVVRVQQALAQANLDQVYLQTRVEYFTLARFDQLETAAAASLRRARITAKDVQSMYEAGVADSTDLLEADLNLTEASFALTQAKNMRRRSELRLLILLGLNPQDSLTLSDALVTPSVPTLPPIIADSKPELRAAEATMAMRRAERDLSHSAYLPTVSLMGGWSYGKPNLDRFNNEWNDYWTVGAQISWSFNIGNKTGEQVRASTWQLRAAERQRDEVAETLQREVQLRFEELTLALERYRSADRQWQLARSNYRLARDRFQAGDLPSNRLLEIEQMLSSAESSRAAAAAEYHIARSAYLYALGSDQLKEGR